jgi:LPS-assembly protein
MLGTALLGGVLPLPAVAAPAPEKPAAAPDNKPQDLLEIEADKATYDADKKLYTAEGNVVLNYQGRSVRADRVTYDEGKSEVHATGNVVLRDPSGAVFVADDVQLTDDLERGFIKGVQGILADGSQLAAAQGERNGTKSTLSYAVYSPCEVCDGKTPLWQIKARQVVHDEADKTLRYKDAVLEVKGLPVFYLPYFEHPDPTVDRRTGFLTPNFSTDSELGLGIEVPFYWAPSPNRDFTITPKITTNEGVILFGQYRENVGFGSHQIEGSITRPKERDANNELTGDREIRGHIFGTGRYDLGDSWNGGFDVAWASDDTYLRRYDISRADSLTNNLFVDKITNHTYFAVNTYAFQGLRQEDVQDRIPIILPMVDYQYRSDPGFLNGTWTAQGNMLALQRREGDDMYRLSGSASYEVPYTNDLGQVYKLTAAFRSDLYFIHDPDKVDDTSSVEGRTAPSVALDWSWPFARSVGHTEHIIEPVVSFVAAPDDKKNPIPNEDSIDVQFSDLNLFRHDRSPGFDIWESGVRANYGLRYSVVGEGGVQGSVLLGQSWRLTGQSPFPADSGLGDHRSDIVTGVTLTIPGWLDLHHSMRLDDNSLHIEMNQVELYAGPTDARLRVGYLDAAAQGFDTSLPHREEINLGGFLRLSDSWSTSGTIIQSFDNAVGTIEWEYGVTYQGRCIRIETSLRRNYARDRDIRPTTSVFVKIALANLGG